jgi:cardiolipin synthase A/B
LLAAGVRVYEYEPRMLHAKTIVFDGERSVLGTANLDYRSFFLNHEINLVSGSRSLAQRLRRDFDRDLLESTEVMQARWTQRRRHRHLLEGIGWMLRRWL